MEPHYLELELTESVVMQDAEVSILTLTELKEMGLSLSIDDFGTGYSSLSYLKRLPIDKLKIDRSFVRDVNNDPDDAEIIRGIISMAHSLGLKVIAEGVETKAQMTFLRSKSCDYIQGYYIGYPVTAENIAPLLAKTGDRKQ